MSHYGSTDWDAIVDALRKAHRIGLACHVNPDGDALGSLLGMSLGLTTLGKEISASWPADEVDLPPGYSFLPGEKHLVGPEEMPDVEVFVALDCGALDRLHGLGSNLQDAATSINIDHHPGNEDFATLNLVAPDASSTSELVLLLLKDLDVEIDPDIATCLYAGIVTDTGNFQFSNADPSTLRMAADLLEVGVPKAEIAQAVYESAPFGFLKLAGRVLSRAELLGDERFIYSVLFRQDLEETDVPMEETDKLIDLLRSTRDATVAAIFKEQGDGSFRVSLRSKGEVSVGEIARRHGGGGHELAAGFTSYDVAETVDDIRRVLSTT